MKTLVRRLSSYPRPFTTLLSTSVLLLLLGGALLFGWVARSRADLHLDISPTGTNALVTWTNTGVVLQNSLSVTGAWSDLLEAASPYPVPTTNEASFFRLRQATATSAAITDLEPAYLTTAGGTIYLVGTNFAPGAAVYIGGVLAGSVTFINSNLLQVTVGALGAGIYDVSVVNPGETSAVLANSLTVANNPVASAETPPNLSGIAAGELRESAVDLAIPCGIGPSFTLARTYRSRLGPTNSPIGACWAFSDDISVRTNGANMIVSDGTGRADTFFLQGDGTYSRAGFFRQGTVSGQTFTLTFADKSQWVFNAFNAAIAPGKIASNIDRNGNAMTYAYDATGQLTNVTDAVGRVVQFTYNGSGQLTNVTDFTGRSVRYQYDGNNNLASVTTPAVTGTPNGNDFPSGKTIAYTYTSGNADDRLNHNLTSIVDPTGTVMETNQYSASVNPADVDFDHLISSAEGPNLATVYSYEAQTPTPANRYATVKVYANDPAGNVTRTFYDSRNRPVQADEYTGRSTPGVAVTSVSNLPTGQVRVTDPAYFETTYSYNLDSRVTQVTWPRGNSDAMVYAYDANNATPVRERGNRLSLTQTPAPGAPADQAQRVFQWSYQSGFGTPESGRATAPTQLTDPLGRVTTGTYDANGNCLSFSPPGLATGHNFEYNPAGQMTAHISPADANARRQRDTFIYYSSGPQKGYRQYDIADALDFALTTTYSYDAAGNMTNSVDPRGNNSRYVYNQLDQLMRELSPPGVAGLRSQTDYTYDQAGTEGGRKVAEAVQNFDQNGTPGADAQLTTRYVYDALGRLTRQTNQVSGASVTVTRYGYDANEQLTNEMSPLAVSGVQALNTMRYRYDERGLLFQETSAPGSANQSTTQYDYDANGNLSRVTEAMEGTPSIKTVVANGFDSPAGNSMSFINVFASVATSSDSGARGHGRSNARAFKASKDVAPVDPGTDYSDARGHGRSRAVIYKNSKDVAPVDPGADYSAARGHGRSKQYVYKNSKDVAPVDPGADYSAARGHGRSRAVIYKNSKDVAPVDPGADYSDARGHGRSNARAFKASKDVAPVDPGADYSDARGHGRSKQYVYKNSKDVAPLDPGVGGDLSPAATFYDVFADVASGADGIPTANIKYYRLVDNSGSGTAADAGVRNFPGESFFDVFGGDGGDFPISSFFDVFTDVVPTITWGSVPAVIIDPLGNTITNHYDACDNLVSTSVRGTNGVSGTVALGSTTFAYDALDRLTNRTATILDASGNPTGTATTTAAYADCSQVTAVTDPLGHTTTYTYDHADRLHSVTDPKGNSVTDGYDANGNIITETNRLKSDLGSPDYFSTKSFGYDALNRCTNSTDGAGNTIVYAFDSRGNLVQTTDPRGIVSQYQYDGLSRQIVFGRDQNGDGNAFGVADLITTNAYDANSRLIAQTDPNLNTTTYAYDALNRHTSTTRPDGTVLSVTYDVHDNLTGATDPNGTVIANAYDLNCQRTASVVTPGGGVATTTTLEQYRYDGMGRTVRAVNNSSTNIYAYDSLDRRISDTQNGLTLTSTHDAVGNILTTTYPGGRQLGYTYDAANLCRSVALLATSDGDTLGVLVTNHFLGGYQEMSAPRNGTYTVFSYNGNTVVANDPGDYGWGHIRRIQHFNTNGTVIDALTFTYDRAQNKTVKTTVHPGQTNTVAYSYDNSERLTNTLVQTNSGLARNTIYALDKAGNRQFVMGDQHPGSYSLNSTTPVPADFQMNQYTAAPVGSFTYDQNGNRLMEITNATPLRIHSYDFSDHPAGIIQYSGVVTSLTITNFSFETNTIPVPNGAFVYQFPSAWTLYDPSNIISSTNALGIMNALASPFIPGGTTHGTNAALVYLTTIQPNVVLGLQRTLTNVLQPNTQYALQVDVGNPQAGVSVAGSSGGAGIFYNFAGFPGYRLDLLAGATVIATDNNSIGATIPEGQFRTATLNLNSLAFPGFVGQPLTLRLVNLKLGGLEVLFDNVRLTATSSPTPAPLASYLYDALGRRIQKSVYAGGVTNVTKYFYDGEDVIEERNAAGTVTATFAAWPDCEDPQGDTIVALSRVNGTNLWAHTDDQASMMAVTLDNGVVAERYVYQDYGEVSFLNAAGAVIPGSAVGNTWLFTGLEYDSETGFYTCDRDLDPRIGSWLQIDPMGIWYDPGTRGNGHNYVGNNPGTYTDAPDTGGERGQRRGKLAKRAHRSKK